jgi:hypothetical protein
VGVTAGGRGAGVTVASGVGSGCVVTGVGRMVGPTGEGTGAVAVGPTGDGTGVVVAGPGGLVDGSAELAAKAGRARGASSTTEPP